VPQTTRITKKAAATIVFGIGSFMLMADMMVVVLIEGENGGNIIEMGFPSYLGLAGLSLWVVGIVLLVLHRRQVASRRKESIRPIFLHGRKEFKCRSCGEMIDCSDVDFHERVVCKCKVPYDVFEGERT
jgi:hypothetical protein